MEGESSVSHSSRDNRPGRIPGLGTGVVVGAFVHGRRANFFPRPVRFLRKRRSYVYPRFPFSEEKGYNLGSRVGIVPEADGFPFPTSSGLEFSFSRGGRRTGHVLSASHW